MPAGPGKRIRFLCLQALAAFFLLLGSSAWLQATTSITLAWPPNPDPNIAGYLLHYGTVSGLYPNIVNVGNVTNAVISSLIPGQTYYLVVTAYDSFGLESMPSPEIVYTIPDGSKVVKFVANPLTVQGNGQVKLTIAGPVGQTAILLRSTNMLNWTAVATNVLVSSNLSFNFIEPPSASRSHFYRVLLP